MFRDLVQNPLPYSDPRVVPLDERIAMLGRPQPRVAWVYESPDSSTFRYRVTNMIEALTADRATSAAWFRLSETPALLPLLPKLNVLIICRTRYSTQLGRLLTAARTAGLRVLFDCDDLVFDTRYTHLLLETIDQNTASDAVWDFWFSYIARLEATMRLCDGGIATNPSLAARMEDAVPGRPVAIIPNTLNREQQMASQQLLETKRRRGFRGNGAITFGYFSGSPSHNRDFAIVAPALSRLLREDRDIAVRIVGFLDSLGPLGEYSNRVEFVPLQDPINLQNKIAEVEVNLAPLQENVFTHCKSELKFFEAASVGTWTIASPTSSFRAAIRDGLTGRLARAHEWDDALHEAVALARNPASHYIENLETAATDAFSAYGWDRSSVKLRDALGLGAPERQT